MDFNGTEWTPIVVVDHQDFRQDNLLILKNYFSRQLILYTQIYTQCLEIAVENGKFPPHSETCLQGPVRWHELLRHPKHIFRQPLAEDDSKGGENAGTQV